MQKTIFAPPHMRIALFPYPEVFRWRGSLEAVVYEGEMRKNVVRLM